MATRTLTSVSNDVARINQKMGEITGGLTFTAP